MNARATTVIALLCLAFALSAHSVQAQASAESIAFWTEQLQRGTLVERIDAAGKLAAQDPSSLPPATREAIIAELKRLNDALLFDLPVEGLDEVNSESFGEYYLALTVTAAQFRTPEANRALVLSVGVSRGVQRRAAQLGDRGIPVLADMIARDYQAGDALETMALAWFWSDSTGGPLSDASRRTIIGHLIPATRSDNYELRLSSARALDLIRDPVFLPLATEFQEREASGGKAYIRGVLRVDVIPALEAAAAALSEEQWTARTGRVVDLACDLGWITHQSVCDNLRQRLEHVERELARGRPRHAAGHLRNFLQDLEGAHRHDPKRVNDDAFVLLHGSGELLLSRL